MFEFFTELFSKNKIRWSDSNPNNRVYYRQEDKELAKNLLSVRSLIRQIMAKSLSDEDCVRVANRWIDSPSVHIRENNNYDNTIDELLPKNPTEKLKMAADQPVFQLASQYVVSQTPGDDVMDKALDVIVQRVRSQFEILLAEQLKYVGGLNNMIRIITSISDQNSAFLLEMYDERTTFESIQKPECEEKLQNFCSLIASGSSLRGSSAYVDKICSSAYSLATIQREILRRTYAINLFNWLQLFLDTNYFKLKKFLSLLELVDNELSIRLNALVEIDDRKQSALVMERNVDAKHYLHEVLDGNLLALSEMTPEQIIDSMSNFVSGKKL